jgi:hypothetical protein
MLHTGLLHPITVPLSKSCLTSNSPTSPYQPPPADVCALRSRTIREITCSELKVSYCKVLSSLAIHHWNEQKWSYILQMYILVKLLISPVSPSHPACNWLITLKQDSKLLCNADTHGLVQRISSHVLCSPVNHCSSALRYGCTPVLLFTPLRSERSASNICRAWMPQTTSHLASSSKHWLQW